MNLITPKIWSVACLHGNDFVVFAQLKFDQVGRPFKMVHSQRGNAENANLYWRCRPDRPML